MSFFPKFLKDRTGEIFNRDGQPKIDFSNVSAVIQGVGGVALAYYLFEDPTYRILPYMCCTVGVIGTCNLLKIVKKAEREAKNPEISASIQTNPMKKTIWDLATGSFTYFTSVYVLSDGLKCNDKMWIPSLAMAVAGYYTAVTYIDKIDLDSNRNIFLLYYPLVFEPALIVSSATYLLYFRNHKEEFLYWIPFLLSVVTGYKISLSGLFKTETEMTRKLQLFKAIELLTGGSLLAIGGTVLAISASLHGFNQIWIIAPLIVAVFGGFVIFGSITCFRRFTDMDREIFYSLVGMIAGPVTFVYCCLVIKCVQDSKIAYISLLSLGGFGHVLVFKSVLTLYKLLPQPMVHIYCQRVLGPVMVVYSMFAAAWIRSHMGKWYALAFVPFIPAGIYATYEGFRKRDELQ